MSSDVLLVCCAEFPDGDEDGAEILAALDGLGVQAQWRDWDDPSAPWSSTPTVLRAAWDYTRRRDDFLAWARGVPTLFNPYDVVLWNSDKVYLRDLAEAGVPITPTTFAAPGEHVVIDEAFAEVVVKPSVGAGSRGAGRFADSEAAHEHAGALHAAGRTVLVQPYLDAVDTAGETALIYLAGEFSHAVRKGALLTPGAAHAVDGEGLYLPETMSTRTASDAELAVGAQALAFLADRFGAVLYARIDLLPSAHGPVVVEVEVTEPSLFLSYADGAVDRFAAAVAALLR